MKPENTKKDFIQQGMVNIFLVMKHLAAQCSKHKNKHCPCPQILSPPLETTDSQQDIFSQEEQIVQPCRAEAVPLHVHDQPSCTEEPLQAGAGSWRCEIPKKKQVSCLLFKK